MCSNKTANVFQIIEKWCPILEAIGVLLIPTVVWWISYSYQVDKDKQEKAIRQQEAIKTYLNQITTIFLDGDIQKNPNLQKVSRASTLALLKDPNMRRDEKGQGDGKGKVITFLSEIGLITQEKKEIQKPAKKPATPIISLSTADLSGANLSGANLRGVDLSEADLSGADLTYANLRGANLRGADLIGANLFGAKLIAAKLIAANLNSADLRVAIFSFLDDPITFPSGADLSGADFSGANLSGAILRGVDLSKAELSKAELSKAELFGMKNFLSKQIKSAKNWESALYDGKRLDDPEVSEKLGLNAKP